MGIDSHSLQLLCHAREKFGGLGDTITRACWPYCWAHERHRGYVAAENMSREPSARKPLRVSHTNSNGSIRHECTAIAFKWNQPVTSSIGDRARGHTTLASVSSGGVRPMVA